MLSRKALSLLAAIACLALLLLGGPVTAAPQSWAFEGAYLKYEVHTRVEVSGFTMPSTPTGIPFTPTMPSGPQAFETVSEYTVTIKEVADEYFKAGVTVKILSTGGWTPPPGFEVPTFLEVGEHTVSWTASPGRSWFYVDPSRLPLGGVVTNTTTIETPYGTRTATVELRYDLNTGILTYAHVVSTVSWQGVEYHMECTITLKETNVPGVSTATRAAPTTPTTPTTPTPTPTTQAASPGREAGTPAGLGGLMLPVAVVVVVAVIGGAALVLVRRR